jgi:pimeloyl-ACP methyl ester carboxylesterase
LPAVALATDIGELLVLLGIGRAVLVGLSMGGLVTMELAASHPERFLRAHAPG